VKQGRASPQKKAQRLLKARNAHRKKKKSPGKKRVRGIIFFKFWGKPKKNHQKDLNRYTYQLETIAKRGVLKLYREPEFRMNRETKGTNCGTGVQRLEGMAKGPVRPVSQKVLFLLVSRGARGGRASFPKIKITKQKICGEITSFVGSRVMKQVH